MKHNIVFYSLVAVMALVLTSCEVEFSPNAEYVETPVVYCVLDQDDDTTWVRVERCFLEDGNIYNYGSQSQLYTYPQGSLQVSLKAYRYGNLVSTVTLADTLLPHADGSFDNTPQPVYFTATHLDTTCMYQLQVRRVANDSLIASTDSIPLLLQRETSLITSPTNTQRFRFVGGKCRIAWTELVNTRRYQPYVRFYYGEEEDTLYVDLFCNIVTSGYLNTEYSLQSFLNSLKEALKDDTNHKEYLEMVDIYLTACDEHLNAYMNSVSNGTNLNQTTDAYTNIRGGVGVFAARRTHLYKSFLADNSMLPIQSSNPGLRAYLKELGIGFD
ncbi:MAG: DUF4249 family protein [Bacteroidales bacterium]|nr:DUF4249 family protein [Bacteroidales bacterium]